MNHLRYSAALFALLALLAGLAHGETRVGSSSAASIKGNFSSIGLADDTSGTVNLSASSGVASFIVPPTGGGTSRIGWGLNGAGLHVAGTGLTSSDFASLGPIKTESGIEDLTTGGLAGPHAGLDFDCNNGTTADVVCGGIYTYKEDGVSGQNNWALAFAVRSNGNNAAEAMRISSAGNLGIGTTSPSASYKFSVVSASNAINNMFMQNTDATGFSTFDLKDSSGTTQGQILYANSGSAVPSTMLVGTNNAQPFWLYTGTTNLFIAADGTTGNLAIGKKITLPAGTTSNAPLVFLSGTNLTAAAAGAQEFDGTVFYATAIASTRQVLDAEQFITLTSTYTLTNQTAAQKLFNSSTNGTVTLGANTTYFFDAVFSLSSLSSSSHSIGFAFAGTAARTRELWQANCAQAALATASTLQSTFNTAANTTLVTASTTTTAYCHISGKLVIGTGGTLVPSVSQLTNSAAAVVGVDSYFRIWPAGSNTVTTVGNWS